MELLNMGRHFQLRRRKRPLMDYFSEWSKISHDGCFPAPFGRAEVAAALVVSTAFRLPGSATIQ
jgi:hypothetical protein